MKSYIEVLKEHYPGVLWAANVVHNDGDGAYLKLVEWPTDICACPTAEHIESLRGE